MSLAFSLWQRLRIILLPSAAPQVLVGLRQSLAIAWLTLIVAEQINADKGIGFLINKRARFPADRHHHFLPGRLRVAGHRHRRRRPSPGTSSPEVPRMTITSDRQTAVVGKLSNVSKLYGKPAHPRRHLAGGPGERNRRAGRSQRMRQVDRITSAGRAFRRPRRQPRGQRRSPPSRFRSRGSSPWRDVLTNVQYGLTRTTLSPRGGPRRAASGLLAEIGLTDHAPVLAADPVRRSSATGFAGACTGGPNRSCCCSTNRSARWTR